MNLSGVIQEKKCLVVLDDIWEVDDWKFFSNIIPDEEGQTKILLTTRIEEVAKVGFVQKQRLLNEEEGLMLLHKKALPRHRLNDPQLEKYLSEFGREMIEKCGKLPLAIAVLGGILRSRVSLKDWEKIHNDIDSTLDQDLGNLGEGRTISKVLSLSYYDLPHFLKPCFLYLSVYREDEIIDPKNLYQLWIADGLISKQYCLKGETLMDVADRFLKALISRSMIQVEADPILEFFWWFRVHDTMRALCLHMAREEYFLETLTDETRPSVIGDAPRYSIHIPVNEGDEARCLDPFKPITSAYVRAISFGIGGSSRWLRNEHTVKASVENFELLRILEFKFCLFHEKEVPRGMDRLIHLRYLSLFGCDVKELPSSVGNLPLLQTLDLRTVSTILIPHDIFSKKSPLMHLYLHKFTCRPERKLHLTGLGKLESFILTREDENSPIEFMELNIIRVEGKQLGEAVLMSPHVTRLCLKSVDLQMFPSFEPQFGQNLEYLILEYCRHVDGTVLFEWLGKMQNLRKLSYYDSAHIRVMNFDHKNFLQLRSLKMVNMRGLEELMIGEGSLPNLMELEIDHCDKLKIVPEDGLKYVDNLRELCLGMEMSSLKNICQMHHSLYPHVKIVDSNYGLQKLQIDYFRKVPLSMRRWKAFF